jgi:uncharacterized protein (TIGR02246 family)
MDEQLIRGLVAAYVETWNRHDMDAWGRLFTDDADYVNRAGGWWKSNRDSVDGHKAIHDMLVRQKQPMTYRSDVAKVAFLKPDIALVHATWAWPGFAGPSGEEQQDFKGVITMVVVKRDGRWLIRAVHNTVASGPPPPSPPPAPAKRPAAR